MVETWQKERSVFLLNLFSARVQSIDGHIKLNISSREALYSIHQIENTSSKTFHVLFGISSEVTLKK